MRTFVPIVFLLGWLSVGCHRTDRTQSERTNGNEEAEPDPLVERSRQLAYRLRTAEHRLAEAMPPVTQFHQQSCPDEEIASQTSGAAGRELMLTTHDARYEAHSLLPLTLVQPLETPSDVLTRFFEDSEDGLTSPLARLLRSAEVADAAEREVVELEQRAYKGVFHLTLFKKAHLIRKKNRRRREWTKGVLMGWLVIYDIDASEPVCQVSVTTVNDVEDEPISIRLRPDTQRKLVHELGLQLLEEARRALPSITSVLTLPRTSVSPA